MAAASFARSGWSWYKSMLSRRPLATKAATSSVVMAISDILCQRMEEHIRKAKEEDHHHHGNAPVRPKDFFQLDWRRTLHVALTGLTYNGPLSHFWYNGLERVVRIEHRWLGLAARMFLDAFVFSPVAVGGYFIWRGTLDGKQPAQVWEHVRERFYGALQASWQFWPLANIVNYSFVPIQYRVLYNNTLSLMWTGYLSHVNAKRLEEVLDDRAKHPRLIIVPDMKHVSGFLKGKQEESDTDKENKMEKGKCKWS